MCCPIIRGKLVLASSKSLTEGSCSHSAGVNETNRHQEMKGTGKGKPQGAQSDGYAGSGRIPSSADLEVTMPFANENHVGFVTAPSCRTAFPIEPHAVCQQPKRRQETPAVLLTILFMGWWYSCYALHSDGFRSCGAAAWAVGNWLLNYCISPASQFVLWFSLGAVSRLLPCRLSWLWL